MDEEKTEDNFELIMEYFNTDLVKEYPKSVKRVPIEVGNYNLQASQSFNSIEKQQLKTTHLSPHGISFKTTTKHQIGELLKISIKIPNYWERKKSIVDYNRIDVPTDFKVLAKVVESTPVGKRGKQRLTLVKTVNIDSSDKEVLEMFLKEGK